MNTTQNCLDLFWHLKNGKIATLDRYFFDAFLPKICAKWPVSTISIPSAEALAQAGKRQLEFPVNVRDLRDAESVEFGFMPNLK